MKKLPKNILKLFWGDDLKDLDWGKAQRLYCQNDTFKRRHQRD